MTTEHDHAAMAVRLRSRIDKARTQVAVIRDRHTAATGRLKTALRSLKDHGCSGTTAKDILTDARTRLATIDREAAQLEAKATEHVERAEQYIREANP